VHPAPTITLRPNAPIRMQVTRRERRESPLAAVATSTPGTEVSS
jgi:hypothetical protein